MRRVSLLLLLGVACGEVPAHSPAHPVSGPVRPMVLSGRVVANPDDTTAGTPTLYLEGGQAVRISGGLSSEIQRLGGARITVLGTLKADALMVQHYAVLEVNGERPQVGVVTRRHDGYALFQESGAMDLDSSTAPIPSLVGAKIWAIGSMANARLRITAFGVIRQADR